jgi:xanthine dehydrogenase accessory factor
MTIGVGPGFEAGVDVDLVVESKRGHYLGKVIYEGQAAKDTGIPGETMGYTEERIIRSPKKGIVKPILKIGDTVNAGEIVCHVGDVAVEARISGILRGLIREGLSVPERAKIGDIDPRGIRDYTFTISDKARAVAGGVLEAIQYLRNERGV